MKISVKYIILVIVLVVAGIVWSSLSQPGVADLKGDFTIVATQRNENNTGPVHRIYAVTVSDTLWSEMGQYGDYMPYSKLGTTTVWFFEAGSSTPDKLSPDIPNFPASFNSTCLGKYEKNSMGSTSLLRYPFR